MRPPAPYRHGRPPLPRIGRVRRPLARAGLIAGGVALAVAVGVGAAHLAAGPSDHATPAPSSAPAPTAARGIPSTQQQSARTAGLDALLAARARAVFAHDLAAWTATVDPADPAFVAEQRALFATTQQLPLSRWSYQDGGPGPALTAAARTRLGGTDAWIARVVLTYRLAGYDRADVTRESFHTVVERGGRWFLGGTSDAVAVGQPSQVDVWDLGPATVVRGGSSLVVGRLPRATLAARAAEADQAVEAVDRVWTAPWSRRVVLLVPASLSEMKTLSGNGGAGLDQIAALTTGERVNGTTGTEADRVLLNPAAFAALSPLGRRVVLAHETTHVATRAITRTFPVSWLSEGFADYVGYLGTGITVQTAAADALAQVRAGTVPAHLPTDADFDAASRAVSPAYAFSWLACRLIAQRYGQAALFRFYAAAASSGTGDAGQALADAWRSLGTDETSFVRAWQADLRTEAAA